MEASQESRGLGVAPICEEEDDCFLPSYYFLYLPSLSHKQLRFDTMMRNKRERERRAQALAHTHTQGENTTQR